MSKSWRNEWLELAYEDLHSAEYLLTMHLPAVEIICYYCEQAADKFLKAFLVQHDREPPKTHDLIQLCKLCEEIDAQFEQMAGACIELTPYGVQGRYPSNLELDEEDAACALKECRHVHDLVCQKLRCELKRGGVDMSAAAYEEREKMYRHLYAEEINRLSGETDCTPEEFDKEMEELFRSYEK